MSESAIKANQHEAHRLYQRGVAAARAGQRRVAAGLLGRSVRLNPDSEDAWLWLSGVVDDPTQQEFCLRTVLKINPENHRAQRGLHQLESRGRTATSGAVPPEPPLPLPKLASREGLERRDSWWVTFRRHRQEMGHARLLIWTFPIMLVCVALLLHESFAFAVARSIAAQAPPATSITQLATRLPTPRPTLVPTLEAEPLAVTEGLSAAYLSALEPIRVGLRTATADYLAATTQISGGSMGAVAANQRLRAAVTEALVALRALQPPLLLQQAHADYLRGLELQRNGLDAILDFYSSYEVAKANQAALSFQEARAYITRAQRGLEDQARHLAALGAVASQTAR